ncbi:MAG: acyl-CoA desaturase [Cytophagaceae bacterium]|nr:acyl-CoA desaturase [Cytophagaceae bacterium]MDW8456365.1 acyl-CoA desaturase [Cytophagaceae bacterium]
MAIIIFFLAHWYLSLFSQTFFLHRYGAHKMFVMTKFWERFFFIFTWLTQGSSFLSPRAYAILHRMHHEYSDTERDPHSPHFSNNIFSMMFKTWKIFTNINKQEYQKLNIDEKFRKDLPEWNFVDTVGSSWTSRIIWGTAYGLFYIYFADHWTLFLLLPIHFFMGPVHGAIVNWCGHKLGYANYDNNDKSKNSLVIDILLGGELYQNNHHKYANRPNFATKWFEFDITYPIIKLLSWVRIIRLNTVTA